MIKLIRCLNFQVTLKRLYNFISFDKSIKNIENSLRDETDDTTELPISSKSSIINIDFIVIILFYVKKHINYLDKKTNKEKFNSFFKSIDNKNGILLDRVVKNQNSIVDRLQIKHSKVITN